MNALYVIHKYLEIKAGKLPKRKITVIFGGKAAPAYIIAQDIIHLILCLSELINNDPEVNKYLNVHLVENYNVSVAENSFQQPIFLSRFHLPLKKLLVQGI